MFIQILSKSKFSLKMIKNFHKTRENDSIFHVFFIHNLKIIPMIIASLVVARKINKKVWKWKVRSWFHHQKVLFVPQSFKRKFTTTRKTNWSHKVLWKLPNIKNHAVGGFSIKFIDAILTQLSSSGYNLNQCHP